MKTDYKRSNRIIAEWPEETPLALQDKVFVAVIALLTLVPIGHLAFAYGRLPAEIVLVGDVSSKWLLLVVAGGDLLCAASAIAQIVFPRPIFVADELIGRPAEEIIHGMRLSAGLMGCLFALFLGYVLEASLSGRACHTTVLVGAIVLIVLTGMATVIWLKRGKGLDEE